MHLQRSELKSHPLEGLPSLNQHGFRGFLKLLKVFFFSLFFAIAQLEASTQGYALPPVSGMIPPEDIWHRWHFDGTGFMPGDVSRIRQALKA